MWLDPWTLIVGLGGLIVVATGVATWMVAFPAAVLWSRRRKARVAEWEQAFAAGMEKGLEEGRRAGFSAGLAARPQLRPNLRPVRTPEPTVAVRPDRADTGRASAQDGAVLATIQAVRAARPSPIGKRWKPGIQHTTTFPTVTAAGQEPT